MVLKGDKSAFVSYNIVNFGLDINKYEINKLELMIFIYKKRSASVYENQPEKHKLNICCLYIISF